MVAAERCIVRNMTTAPKVFDMEPVERLLASPEEALGYKELTRRLKNVISTATFRRYRENGMTAWQADMLACQGLGLHPMNVWGELWFEQAYAAWEEGLD
jgi:hypothetical protein